MKASINKLVQSLLQKDTLEQCSVTELLQLANQYPYFGAAQLLLAKKLQNESNDQYNEQLQKTSLLFHNPMWLEHLLNDTGNAGIIAAKKIEPAILNEIKTESNIISSQKEPEPVSEIPSLKAETFDPDKTELSFEPYYTVDYFASQGIKFREEERPKDKFGQQLKSFTDWVKTMKRLPISEMAQIVTNNAEQKVKQLAEHSLQDREVITEAMAEVWKKQGNMAKAIEIYNKLSLLDPSKSAYFAAEIEDLKKIN